jgi:peptidoglycan/xylan/chitin deacetylase (PgdA/CDA1 family)
MPLPPERLAYSAIVDRAPLRLPDGARIAVWTIVNVEHWGADRPMPRTVLSPPMGQPLQPDLPNWAWHEYGMRVGFWRLHETMRRFGVTPTLAINGSVCRAYPRVAEAALESGWEFMGHGFVQMPMHALADQGEAIRATIDAVRAFTGRAPRGWESPGLTETGETLDLLSAAGIEYVADWVIDDQPVELKATPRPVLSIPYTVEANDVVIFALQHHSGEELAKRCIAQFDRLYEESADSARVMAISVHPYITGVPHRVSWLESVYRHIAARSGVKLWTGEQILDWYRHGAGGLQTR